MQTKMRELKTQKGDLSEFFQTILIQIYFSSFLGSNLRWTSRENLLTAATDEDPQLFVSLYDFQAGGENQLSLRKTEQVRILSYNKSGEWCEAHNAQGNWYIVLYKKVL